MNKKGQALVEFILIIPIFVMMMLAAFDWVRILQTKTSLEDKLDTFINSEIKEDDIDYSVKNEEKYKIYSASINVDIYSPILIPIIGSDYTAKVERTIYE